MKNFANRAYGGYGAAVSALLVGFLVAMITVVGWVFLVERENAQVEQLVSNRQVQVANVLDNEMRQLVNALSRMAFRWEANSGTPKELWTVDARNLVENFGYFQAIEWADESFKVQWIEPIEGNEEAQGLDLSFELRRRAALIHARDSGVYMSTKSVDLVQGGKGFIIFSPIGSGSRERFDGFILGVFRISALFSKLTADLQSDFSIEIREDDTIIYSSTGTPHAESSDGNSIPPAHTNVLGNNWSIALLPNPSFLDSADSRLPLVLLCSGLLLAASLSGLIYFAMMTLRSLRFVEKSERVLADSELRHRRVVEAVPTGLVTVDREGTIVDVNSSAERMFGYGRDEFLGQRIEILVPEALRDAHQHHRETFARQPIDRRLGQNGELRARRQDGSVFPVEISLSPIDAAEGKKVLATVLDITERKEAADRNLRHTKKLEQLNADLEHSNKELDDFAYVASHDLKAPLRAIDNLSKWVVDDAADVLPAESKRHLEQLQQRTQRMESLLDDLLQFSRAGRDKGEQQEVDSTEFARDIVDFVGPPGGFEVRVAPNMPRLMVYVAPFRQVLLNLVTNAIKHHNRQDGIIDIHAQEHGDFVEFSVSDDGPGIPCEHHGRIFEMFQTLRPRDEVEGSGMGLAVVKKIVESQGGTIRLESVDGQGATFVFTWPTTPSRETPS